MEGYWKTQIFSEEKRELMRANNFSFCILTWRVAATVCSEVQCHWGLNDKEHRTWSLSH
jgi:hypothetical protein